MRTNSSAPAREETPHATTTISNKPISNAIKRRAQSLLKDKTIDVTDRIWIRHALEINDAVGLTELVRRADAGEPIIDDSHLFEANEAALIEEKLERLTEMICDAGDRPETKSAALLVLMSMLENSKDPKLLANQVKHVAFTCCGELDCFGMVDAQIATIETELLASPIAD